MASISVCMACYNGAKYIEKQLNSILIQLDKNDEVIVIDDCSSDDTPKIIQSIADSRIRFFENKKRCGVNKNFERAISLAEKGYIFMADQDDIWTPGRKNKMLEPMLNGKTLLISGNTVAINAEGKDIDYNLGKLSSASSRKYKKNIVDIMLGRAYYYGCAMAFNKKLNKIILPFPEYIESHDLWIAMAANMIHENAHIEDVVLQRRIHGNNASVVDRTLKAKLNSRLIFIKSYIELKRRIRAI